MSADQPHPYVLYQLIVAYPDYKRPSMDIVPGKASADADIRRREFVDAVVNLIRERIDDLDGVTSAKMLEDRVLDSWFGDAHMDNPPYQILTVVNGEYVDETPSLEQLFEAIRPPPLPNKRRRRQTNPTAPTPAPPSDHLNV